MTTTPIFARLSLFLFSGVLTAAVPTLDAVFPSGGQVGSEITVKLVGKMDPWPVKIWTDNDQLEFTTLEKKQEVMVKIPPDASPGSCLVRIFNAEGASLARTFVIGKGPEIAEIEPNDLTKEQQVLERLPILVNGQFNKTDDVDFYRVSLKKGQTLRAKIDSYSLRAAADPFLHLLDSRGYEIAGASVTNNLDPLLSYRAKVDGEFTIQTNALSHGPSANVTFAGGEALVYRMKVWIGELPVTDWPKTTGVEGPTSQKEFQMLKSPTRLQGSISEPGEVDRFKVTATKGEKIFLRVESQLHGQLLDGVMRVIRPDARDYKVVDDLKTNKDPELLVTPPLDGDHTIEIWDRFRRGGGEGFGYQLVVEKPKPAFEATIEKDLYGLKAGKTVDLKLKLTRINGHTAPLKLKALGLPKGVHFVAPEIPEKSGEIKLMLKADENCGASNAPVEFRLVETEEEGTPASKAIEFTFQTTTSAGPYLIDRHTLVWLTVEAKAPEKAEEPKKDKEP